MIQLHSTKKPYTKLPLDAEGCLPDAMALVVREAIRPTKVKARKDSIWPMDEMLALLS